MCVYVLDVSVCVCVCVWLDTVAGEDAGCLLIQGTGGWRLCVCMCWTCPSVCVCVCVCVAGHSGWRRCRLSTHPRLRRLASMCWKRAALTAFQLRWLCCMPPNSSTVAVIVSHTLDYYSYTAFCSLYCHRSTEKTSLLLEIIFKILEGLSRILVINVACISFCMLAGFLIRLCSLDFGIYFVYCRIF